MGKCIYCGLFLWPINISASHHYSKCV